MGMVRCPNCKKSFDEYEEYCIYSYASDKRFCSRECMFNYEKERLNDG